VPTRILPLMFLSRYWNTNSSVILLFHVVRLLVLTVTSKKIIVFLDLALCSVVEIDQHFRGAYCFYHKGHHHHYPYDGGSEHFWKIGQFLPQYTAQDPRRLSCCFMLAELFSNHTMSWELSIKLLRLTGRLNAKLCTISEISNHGIEYCA
jgi:hypothetical protein